MSSIKTKSNGAEPQLGNKAMQWPTEKEIHGISEQLAELRRVGIHLESTGDYFKSGNLAYRLKEIMSEIRTLVEKTSRKKDEG